MSSSISSIIQILWETSTKRESENKTHETFSNQLHPCLSLMDVYQIW